MFKVRPVELGTLTLLSLLAFAANSLLCRVALGSQAIDPTTFTTVRVVSGAAVLLPWAKIAAPGFAWREAGSWRSATALFTYALAFSLAYRSLSTATGALILFGTVQLTMIGVGLVRGERMSAKETVASLVAATGLLYLLLPGALRPSLRGALLMMLSGCAWGLYSLWGRGVTQPLVMTAGNFARASLFAVVVGLSMRASVHISARGLILAVASGAVTSGVGYAIWYRALRGHSAFSAAVVQLAVPMIAATGGILVLGEQVTARLLVATLLTLGGIGGSLWAKRGVR